jgi:S1-C subfamily serine protease
MLLYWGWPGNQQPEFDPTASPRAIAVAQEPTSEEKSRISIYKKAKDSVVHIASAQRVRDRFSLDIYEVPKGSGTGFFWDEKGRIVTNYHVVEGASNVLVTLSDHTSAIAKKINYNKARDLAVLWIDVPAAKCKPLPLGESSKLHIGQDALAIGNPFGLDQSLSAGIISALGRSMKGEDGSIMRDLIQVDAAINPGNSGGPLLDSSGRLIGVNAAIISPSGAFAGIGFAIPVDVVNSEVPRLIRGVKEPTPSLGIDAAPDQLAKQLGITGVLILNVLADGPAAKAELQSTRRTEDGVLLGDIVVGIDDHPVHSIKELNAVLAQNYHVGQEVIVHIRREGEEKEKEVKVTLGEQR